MNDPMSDRLSQLLRDADASAPAAVRRDTPGDIAHAVRRRRRREIIRTRAITAACVVIGVLALGFSLRRDRPAAEIVQKKQPETPAVTLARLDLDVDARVAELTAQRLLSAEAQRRAPAARRVDVQEQSDRAALVLVYEGDGYARGKRATDAIAAYQRAIELFPQSRWADVARQRLKEFAT
jgi:hypothetical protein